MMGITNLCRNLFIRQAHESTCANFTAVRSIKYFPAPKSYDDVEIPSDRRKLRIVEKVPVYPPTIKAPKMQKRLRYMRGPELIHNKLLHRQYGIQATGGGRLRYEHFEIIRLTIARKLDLKSMFAIWRVEAPWQPITKKGQGQRMGGGKGAIDHYCTPVKAGRIILEIAGNCEYAEVHDMLRIISGRLPFLAEPVSQEIMDKKAEKEKWYQENNINPYNMKYVIQNNLGGCNKWLSPFDYNWFGKYR